MHGLDFRNDGFMFYDISTELVVPYCRMRERRLDSEEEGNARAFCLIYCCILPAPSRSFH